MSDHRLRWLLSASALGNLADGVAKVAFPLLAATITQDPVQIGALSATQFLPWLLLGVFAGALVDRIDRRRAMLVANVVRAAAVAGTTALVWTGIEAMWIVYLAAFVIGAAETVAESATNSIIPSVAAPARLDRANSRFQAAEIVGQTFLGGPIGSTTFAVFAAFPFVLSSAAFAVAAALLIGMAGSYRPRTVETPRLRVDLAEGLKWLARHQTMRRLVLIAGLASLTSELAQAQLVLYALDDLSLSEAAFGLFSFVGGIGGLLGAAVAAPAVRRAGREPVLLAGLLLAGLGFLGMGLTRDPVVAAVLFGLFAAVVVVVNVVLATARHALVPGELLGRVIGAWRTVVWGAVPVGALLGGWLNRELGGASATFVVSGLAQIALAALALGLLRQSSLDRDHAGAG